MKEHVNYELVGWEGGLCACGCESELSNHQNQHKNLQA